MKDSEEEKSGPSVNDTNSLVVHRFTSPHSLKIILKVYLILFWDVDVSVSSECIETHFPEQLQPAFRGLSHHKSPPSSI